MAAPRAAGSCRRQRHLRRRRRRMAAGFTLAELLVGSALTTLVLAALSGLALHQIRFIDRQYALATTHRSFRKLSDLLRDEIDEACLLRTDVDPRTSATPPDTPCHPEPSTPCNASAGQDLRLLIPVLDTATNRLSYTLVRYYLSGRDLLRDGPSVAANGSLTPGSLLNGQRVLTNVTRFRPTVARDCNSVDISVELAVPGSSDLTPPRTLSLAAGANLSIQ